jgi:hypothetical protein
VASGSLGFWPVSIVWYSEGEKKKVQKKRFGNWITFGLYVKEG